MFVDVDAHVDECAETWSYFPKSMLDVRPAELTVVSGQSVPYLDERKKPGDPASQFLFVDGHIHKRMIRNDEATQTTVETRQLYDVPARLKHMDSLGIETQIIFPSTLLAEVTRRPEVEAAICESYNRWLADRCADSNGRLRWNAVLPLRSIPEALREMRRVKEAGAVGIFKRSVESDDRSAGEEYFYPIYELAQELDLPICIHTSSPYRGYDYTSSKTEPPKVPLALTVEAFLSIMKNKVPTKFPSLRIAFLEAGSGWVPYMLWASGSMDMKRQYDWRLGDRTQLNADLEKMVEESRLFFSCEPIEDLPDIIGRIGDRGLIVGTDYSHADRASILNAHTEIVEQGGVDADSAVKLTETNARRLFALT